MSAIKTKNIKQTVINSTVQPLKIGGIAEDGSDAKITIDTSGNTTFSQVTGIKFPATQVPSADANTLDDYEEGTFIPTVYGTTTAGVGTYSFQSGKYTKIGRLVSVEITLGWSSHTGTGYIRIANLPFINTGFRQCANFTAEGLAYSGQLTGLFIGEGNNIIAPYSQTSNGSLVDVPMDSSVGLLFTSGTYIAS